MWNVIEKAAEHVAMYSTLCGQIWYLIVFIFRIIVVATIGSQVYSDEQSSFRCSTKVHGCDNVCYDRFAKISHIRFWAFQILAVTFPVIAFHFYALFVEGRVEKLRDAEVEATPENPESKWNVIRDHVNEQIRRRQKKVGKVMEKKRYHKDKLQVVAFTKSIKIAYFFSVLFRMVIEIIFVYLAFDLFRFAEYPNVSGTVVSDGRRVNNPFDLFWIRVPQLYRCTGKSVRWACGQHMLPGNLDSYVPCWVSRPWEKTIFLRYMNTLSVFCILLCVVELIQLAVEFCGMYKKKLKKLKQSGFNYQKAPSANNFNEPSPPNIAKPVPALTDATYVNQDETVPEKPPKRVSIPENKSFSPLASSSDQKKSSNIFVDLATGAINVDQLREAMEKSKAEPKRKPSRPTNNYSTLPFSKKIPKASGTELDGLKPSKGILLKPKYSIPMGTQSLTRPPKLKKGRYIFKLDSPSFSASEFDEDDGDDGSSESGSSDGSDGYSVSEHSLELDGVV